MAGVRNATRLSFEVKIPLLVKDGSTFRRRAAILVATGCGVFSSVRPAVDARACRCGLPRR